MRSWGCRRGRARRHQERLPQARQEAASRRQQERQEGGGEVRRAQRRLRDPRRRGQAQGVRPRRDRRRGQAALPGLRGLRRGPASGPGGFGQDGDFETFTWGPEGVQRAAARRRRGGGSAAAASTIFSRRCSAAPAPAAARAAGGAHFEPDDFGGGAGPRRHRQLTITLAGAPRARRGGCICRPARKSTSRSRPGSPTARQIRLKGQGLPGPGGSAGDALITVTIAPHPLFERDGADLRLDLPVTLYEAVLGGKVRVPTLDGAVELAIPAGTSSGRRSASRARACRPRTAPATSTSPRASCSPRAATPTSRS